MKPIEKLELWNILGDYLQELTPAELKINELIDAVNELMPQGFDCEQGRHDKCYSIYAIATYPSTRHWICRICGKQGNDTDSYINNNEYDELIEKFCVVKDTLIDK